jgi:hypothetical protein
VLSPPAPGTGQASGRFYCGGEPAVDYRVTLIRLGKVEDRIFLKTRTDAHGWWFINNIPPGKYLRHYGILYAGMLYYTPSETREIKAGQTVDFGWVRRGTCPKKG